MNLGSKKPSPVDRGDGRAVGQPDGATTLPSAHVLEAPTGFLDRYSHQALRQAHRQAEVWFLCSVVGALVGLGIIVWELVETINRPFLETVLRSAPGLITAAVAGLFYRQAGLARQHAASMLEKSQGERRFDVAFMAMRTIEDPVVREDLKVQLVMRYADASAQRPRRAAAPAKGGTPATTEPG